MQDLASGMIDIEVPYLQKRDEIGQMANALLIFKHNAQKMHDITRNFEQSIKQVVGIVASAATEMDSASRDLTNRAEASHGNLKALNTDVMGVAESMQMVSSSGEQLYLSINEINSQMHKSSTTAANAMSETIHVKKVAEKLAESTQKIAGIVGIINGIASKITLLALNATIESARAGEAGKGFAVVATEVKTLATQTANATAEISDLVATMQDSSSETLSAVGKITGIVDEINDITNIIAAAVEEQGAATKEISNHIKQASDRVDSITENILIVTESASASSAAATQTLQASGELSKQSEALRGQVDGFMHNIISGA
jgi:methyl-accepting chemotaxis protein